MESTATTFVPAQEVGEGFRPTDRELVNHFLKLMILGCHYLVSRIPVVDIYKYEPWELPDCSGMSSDGSEWYFFCPRRNINGGRTSRLTKCGFWKSTGKDRIITDEITNKPIGKKKSLVYHSGRTPHGVSTNWIIHEFSATLDLPNQGTFVLCKLMKRPERTANLPTDDGGKLSSGMASNPDHQRSYGNSNLPTPTYSEGLVTENSGHGYNLTGYEEGESISCMDFGFQKGNIHQKGDNSPCDENRTGCLMTSAYENNASCTTTPEELVVEQQQPVPFISCIEHDFSLNPALESCTLTDIESVLSVPGNGFGTSASQSQPNEGGHLHGGNKQNCSPNYATNPQMPAAEGPFHESTCVSASSEDIFYGLEPLSP